MQCILTRTAGFHLLIQNSTFVHALNCTSVSLAIAKELQTSTEKALAVAALQLPRNSDSFI